MLFDELPDALVGAPGSARGTPVHMQAVHRALLRRARDQLTLNQCMIAQISKSEQGSPDRRREKTMKPAALLHCEDQRDATVSPSAE